MFVTFEQPLKRKLWFLLLFLLTLTGSEAQNPFLERLNAFNPLAIARNFLAPVLHLPASRPLRSGPLVIRHQRISSTRTPITAKPSKSIEIKPTTLAPVKLQKNQVEVAEIASNVSCGKVPIFERLYHRSINDSDVINDDHGDFRILHGLDATPYVALQSFVSTSQLTSTDSQLFTSQLSDAEANGHGWYVNVTD